MDSVGVIKVAIGVKRAELMSLHQDHDGPFRTFATDVFHSKVKTCNFTTVIGNVGRLGIKQDFEIVQAKCQVCNCNSLSQLAMPQKVSKHPTSFFEKISVVFLSVC